MINKSRENIPSTSAECLQDPEEISEEFRVGRPTKEWLDLSDHRRWIAIMWQDNIDIILKIAQNKLKFE